MCTHTLAHTYCNASTTHRPCESLTGSWFGDLMDTVDGEGEEAGKHAAVAAGGHSHRKSPEEEDSIQKWGEWVLSTGCACVHVCARMCACMCAHFLSLSLFAYACTVASPSGMHVCARACVTSRGRARGVGNSNLSVVLTVVSTPCLARNVAATSTIAHANSHGSLRYSASSARADKAAGPSQSKASSSLSAKASPPYKAVGSSVTPSWLRIEGQAKSNSDWLLAGSRCVR